MKNSNHKNSSDSNDNKNTKYNHNKSQLLGTRRKGDQSLRHWLLNQMIMTLHPPALSTTLRHFDFSRKTVI